jgi:hypothetical protein
MTALYLEDAPMATSATYGLLEWRTRTPKWTLDAGLHSTDEVVMSLSCPAPAATPDRSSARQRLAELRRRAALRAVDAPAAPAPEHEERESAAGNAALREAQRRSTSLSD